MSTNTPDQQIPRPVGADLADNPLAFTDMLADIETRLVLKYTNEADRTARHTAPLEGDATDLAAEDRRDVYTGAAYISDFTRGLYSKLRLNVSNPAYNADILLDDVVGMAVALPATGIFQWESVVFYDSATAADIQFAYTMPAGATMLWGIHGLASTAAAAVGDLQAATSSVSGTPLVAGGAGVGTIVMALIEGEITMGGTAGNLQLQAAQGTSSATNTTIRDPTRM